jgi:hypothetical protein
VSVLAPDAEVGRAWRPPDTDPSWVADMSGHLQPTPVGELPFLEIGRHLVVVSLLGTNDTPSYNPDGTRATDLLARCTATVEVRAGSGPIAAVVTFPPDGSSFGGRCSIRILAS